MMIPLLDVIVKALVLNLLCYLHMGRLTGLGVKVNGRLCGSLKNLKCHAFHCLSTTSPKRYSFTPLEAGWGRTDKYSWNEDNTHVALTVTFGSNLTADDIEVTIESDALHVVNKRRPTVPLVSGNTKGPVEVDGSFWTIEEKCGIRELTVSLKKSEKSSGYWYGVIKNEVTKQQSYEPVNLQNVNATKAQSLAPGGIFWSREFPMIDADQLLEILKRWMSREKTESNPFGRPRLPIKIGFLSDSYGGKLVYEYDQPDVDEYLKVIVTSVVNDENKHSGGGSNIAFVNSSGTSIISGSRGTEKSDTIKSSLNTLIQNFERDVYRLSDFIRHKQEESDKFDYLGSAAYMDPENLESYVQYHEELRKMAPGKKREHDATKVFKDDAAGVTIDWNPTDDPPNVTKEENELKKKRLIKQLTEAVKNIKKPQPEETIGSLVTSVKQKLALNDVEYNQLMINAVDRIDKETALLKDKQKVFSQLKSVEEIAESQPSVEELKSGPSKMDTFDLAMQYPERSVLARKYETLSSVQKEQLRRRWKSNEKRLQLLITELMQSVPEKCASLCNNYRDLLISEDYPTLMRSYLSFNQTHGKHEKERLTFLNEFVLSLYKDQRIYLIHDEKVQLQKIKQIVDWARLDLETVNDMIAAHKHLYDTNFMCYLNLAISKEVERIRKDEGGIGSLESGLANPLTNPWLCILTVVHRAITALIRADMAEDVYTIGFIADPENPKVRSYLLEFILATMPRSDWKAFKDLIISASNSLINRPPEERDDLEGTAPHFVEAMLQMREEVEKMIPDWIIDEMLSEDDRRFMIENNRRKSPVLQLDLEPKRSMSATQLSQSAKPPVEQRHPIAIKPLR